MKVTQVMLGVKIAAVTIVALGAMSTKAQEASTPLTPEPENAVIATGTLTSASGSVESNLPEKISPQAEVDPALISAVDARPGRSVALNLCSITGSNQRDEATESVQSRSKCAGGPPGSKCGSSPHQGSSSVKPRPQAQARGLQTPETCQGFQQQVTAIRLDPLDTRRQTVEIAFTRDASYVKTVRIEFNSEREAEAYVRNVLTGEINNISGLWDLGSPNSRLCARQATNCTRSDRVASNRAELHREGTAERGAQPVASNSGSTSH